MPTIHGLRSVAIIALVAAAARADVTPLGDFQTNVTVEVPSFRGVAPTVALAYDSSVGDGVAGVGWRLDATSMIARTSPRGGIPTGTPALGDRFTLDGEELVACNPMMQSPSCATAMRWRMSVVGFYATRRESFRRLEYQGGSSPWTVWLPDGHTGHYETYDGGQTWLLTRSEDRHHNGIDYAYTCTPGLECELTSIRWGDNGPVRGAEVHFYYEGRPDERSRGNGAGFVSRPHRLRSITVEVGGALARAYALTYVPSPMSGRSILRSVQQFGRDASVNRTNDPGRITAGATPPLPPRTFDVAATQTAGAGWRFDAIFPSWGLFRMPDNPGNPTPRHYNNAELSSDAGTIWNSEAEDFLPLPFEAVVGDFDGDGRTDVAVGSVRKECQSVGVHAALTRKQGYDEATNAVAPQFTNKGTVDCTPHYLVGDIDGDHRDDIIYKFRGRLFVAHVAGAAFTSLPQSTPWSIDLDHCQLGDVDGDSRDDLVCLDTQPGVVELTTARSRGDGSFDVTHMVPGVGLGDPMAVGDINGDGFADVIFAIPNGSTRKLIVERSLGDGTYATESQTTTWAVGSDDHLHAVELDGDGLADLVLTRNGTGTGDGIALATAGVGGRFEIRSANIGWSSPMFGDVDGDGNTDLVNSTNLTVASADGQGNITGISSYYGPSGCTHPTLGDTDGDGRADVICIAPPVFPSDSFTINDWMSGAPLRGWYRWMSGDFDGDGRSDYAYVYARNPGVGVETVLMSSHATRIDWSVAPSATLPGLDDSSASHWMVADVGSPTTGRADGKDDLVVVDTTGTTLRVYALLSNGNGTYTATYDTPWRDASGATIPFPASDLENFRTLDVDGDGDADLVHLTPSAGGVQVEVLLSNGHGGWSRPAPIAAPTYFAGATPGIVAVSDFQPMEVNGDGLVDLVDIQSGGGMTGTLIRSLINQGDGTFLPATDPNSAAWLDVARWKPMDLNGDGLTDLLHVRTVAGATSVTVWFDELLAHGDGTFGLPLQASATLSTTDPELAGVLDATNSFYATDLDGDGLTDLLHVSRYRDASGNRNTALVELIDPGTATNYAIWSAPTPVKVPRTTMPARAPWAWRSVRDPAHPFSAAFVAFPASETPESVVLDAPGDLLTHIDNGNGGATEIAYAMQIGGRTYMPAGMAPIVSTSVTRVDNAYSPPLRETSSFAYTGAQWSDAQQRMLGFSWVITTDPALGVAGLYAVDEACAGSKVASLTFDAANGNALAVTTNRLAAPAMPPFACDVLQTSKYACDGSCQLQDDVVFTPDGRGNTEQIDEHVTDGPLRTTYTNHNGSDDAYVLSLPAYRFIYDDGKLVSNESFFYDGNSSYLDPPVRGEVTRIDRVDSSNPGSPAVTQMSYDANGLLVRTENPSGTWSTLTYDPTYAAFPIASCTAVGCTTTTWDPVLARIVETTDLSHNPTSTRYDAHGRIVEVRRADGGTTSVQLLDLGRVSGAQAQRQRIRTEIADKSPNDGVAWTVQYLDGWGRTYRTEHEGGAAQLTEYSDLSPRPARVSEIFDMTNAPKRYTEYHYDALGRPTDQLTADGSMKHWAYTPGRIDITDETGRMRSATYDGIGEVIRVSEYVGGVTRDSQYGYDAQHHLVGTTDALGNVTSYYYDSLGRMIAEHDPDRGKREYTYRPDGQIATALDAKGQLIEYTYDATGRLVERDDHDGNGTIVRTVQWTYDALPGQLPNQSLGRVVQIDDRQRTAHVVTSYTYDMMGRVHEDTTCIDTACYEMRHEYDIAGRLATLTYPDAGGRLGGSDEAVDYRYDDAGHLIGVGGYLKDASYELDGRTQMLTLGNGVTTAYSYDPDRRWTTGVATLDRSANPIYVASYRRDASGRITDFDEVSPTNKDTIGYQYDELGRVVDVQATDPALDRHFVIDPIGRITYSSTSGDYHYWDPDHPHAVTRTDFGSTRAYDPNGNAIAVADAGRGLKIAWTVDDRPETIDAGKLTYTFAYDVTGRRVLKDAPGDSALYPNDYVAVENGTFVKYYYAGTRLLARNDGRTSYYHADHTHSTRVETDDTGGVQNSYEYDVMGRPIVEKEAFDDNIGFAGVHGDQALGITYMGARYYDPLTARFLSADSVVRDPYAPQSLDRYAFVEGDPANSWDPSGHMRQLVELMMEEKQQMRKLVVQWYGSFCTGFCTNAVYDPRIGRSQELPSAAALLNAMNEELDKRAREEQEEEQEKQPTTPPPPLNPELMASVQVTYVSTRAAADTVVATADYVDAGEPVQRPATNPDNPPMQTLVVPRDGGIAETVLEFPKESGLNNTSVRVDARVEPDGGIRATAVPGGPGKMGDVVRDGDLLVVPFTTEVNKSNVVEKTTGEVDSKDTSKNKFGAKLDAELQAKTAMLAKILSDAHIKSNLTLDYTHEGESTSNANTKHELTRTNDTTTTWHGSFSIRFLKEPPPP